MTPFSVVIPARYASTRLPGKPLLDIAGQPMLRHVWNRARESGAVRVVVATDDTRIRDACRQFGAEVLITAAEHASGTDRINEAVTSLNVGDGEIVVNVQGDEPMMPPENIRQVAELASTPGIDIATLHVPIASMQEYTDPNVVKLVADANGRALYFSRAPIPWHRDRGEETFAGAVRHLGIYAYRVSALKGFAAAPPCPLEDAEKLEQLRALWMGMTIGTASAVRVPARGVDTAEDLEAVRGAMTV